MTSSSPPKPARESELPKPVEETTDDLIDKLQSRKVVPLRHPWRWAASLVVVVLLAQAAHALTTNDAFQWDAFGYWFTRPVVVEGLLLTLQLTGLSAVFGLLGGILLALMRLSRNPVLQSVAWAYIWLFRSIPLIVLLLFLANITALYATLSLGIPFGPSFVEFSANDLLSFYMVAVLGLSLNEAAYAAEIVRSGIISVDQSQLEAASALGLPKGRQYRRIILPQATRAIIPAYANQLIGLLKGTSVVYITSLLELFGVVQSQASINSGQIIPLLMVGTIWYIVLTSLLSVVQYYLERYFSRGALRTVPPTPFQRLRSRLRTTGVAR
ncbi:amino acid ABC transporter permease [Actinokineospora globicatena]|uniref:Amino acid ABC transporter permease n=1 Tax=Actinokineospora globicatena TaxID=103729 RepID=A0A9W6QQU4_9PSEU|nr:amino acid ABC transporter membrane protein, PAAT family [Actinokineospora globicatena]GLW81597.1 amino acid ABC transporter permease [Actinokineospora globicatena]GLW94380.1 amino acid ABC transporter permease [Actinokineospora globicatena]